MKRAITGMLALLVSAGLGNSAVGIALAADLANGTNGTTPSPGVSSATSAPATSGNAGASATEGGTPPPGTAPAVTTPAATTPVAPPPGAVPAASTPVAPPMPASADAAKQTAPVAGGWSAVKTRGPGILNGVFPNPPADKNDIPDLGIGPQPSPPPGSKIPRGIHIQNEKLSPLFIKKVQEQMEKAIKRGDELYHDDSGISSNGLFCAACHPNAAVTHPETYPKYKQQFDRVVTMQEFINWCIVVPQQGKSQPLGGEVLTAIEAFQAYQNRGLPLEPGFPGP